MDNFFNTENGTNIAAFAIVGLLASLWRYLDPEGDEITAKQKLLRGCVGVAGGVVAGLCAPASWEPEYKLALAAGVAAFQREVAGSLRLVVKKFINSKTP